MDHFDKQNRRQYDSQLDLAQNFEGTAPGQEDKLKTAQGLGLGPDRSPAHGSYFLHEMETCSTDKKQNIVLQKGLKRANIKLK